MLEHWFKLQEHRTTIHKEVMAGLATFLTATYILVVNPDILSSTGMPRDALFTATALAMLVGTMIMAFWANMPLVLAPGMGINAFFAFAVVAGKGYSWQEALTATLIAGVFFLLAGAIGLREAILRGFPETLKHAMTVSLGLMIAGIGLKNAKIIVPQNNLLVLGDITHGGPLLALLGILITGILVALGVRAAVLAGIALTTLLGVFMGVTDSSALFESGVVTLPPSIAPIAFAFSFDWARILTFEFAVIVFTLLAIDIFDSLGTFIGVFNHFDDEERRQYEAGIPKALMADAAATVCGACFGTSTVTTFVESSTGIAAGGRTGLTALTICGLVFVALFASPLFLMVPGAATAPALVVVGMYMMGMARRINFTDASEGIPAVLMVLITTLTVSISDGLMFGWIGYVALKLCSGKKNELNATCLAVCLFFIARMIFL